MAPLEANRIAAAGSHAMDGVIEDGDVIGYVVVVVRYVPPKDDNAVRAQVRELGFSSNLPDKESALDVLDFALKMSRTHKPSYMQTVPRTSKGVD